MKFDPLSDEQREDYFGIASARWVRDNRLYIVDCWYVVYLVLRTPGVTSTPNFRRNFTYRSTAPQIHSRFCHPMGRLFYYEEAVPVVNQLNRLHLSILAARQQLGGLSKLVRRVSEEALHINQGVKPNE